jgi:hypothetical protein
MERLGFGPKTFPLVRDKDGRLVIHMVKGKEPEAAFPRWKGGNGGDPVDASGGEMVKDDWLDPTLFRKPGLEAEGHR